MRPKAVIALLGRRHHPVDGVDDYCTYLAQGFAQEGISLEKVRVPWNHLGWRSALEALREQARDWHSRWVILQYTALQWSVHGVPIRLLEVVRVLKASGCRLAVMFHDARGYPGKRIRDRVRRALQHQVMRWLWKHAGVSVLPIPPNKAPWLPSSPSQVVLIPVGANLPIPSRKPELPKTWDRTVVVFGVTSGPRMFQEAEDIAFSVNRAAREMEVRGGRLTLRILGAGSRTVEPLLRTRLDPRIRLEVDGIVTADRLARSLSNAHVQLFVRRQISGRRGSAIAGIACGVPLVAYAGEETGFPITEAGVATAPYRDPEKLAHALSTVLTHRDLWQDLQQKNIAAYQRYFSWDVLTKQWLQVLS